MSIPINSPLLLSSHLLTSPLPPFSLLPSTPMARMSGTSLLWKETPATSMKKDRLLEIANAKEARIVYLHRKSSECKTSIAGTIPLTMTSNSNPTEERKAALKVLRAALAAAQATQVAAQPVTTTLVPKPRGTSGRAGFNLAKAMDIDPDTYHRIQVCVAFVSPTINLPRPQGFVRTLVNMSALDKTIPWKNQPGDEIHKIFTVVCSSTPTKPDFIDAWPCRLRRNTQS